MNMTNPTIRYRKIDCGIGKQLPISIIAEIYKKKATHVSFHANNIHLLDIICSPQQCNRKKTEEEAIICSGASCLEHLIELDISSNCLHDGYALPPCLNVRKKVSLLGLCSNLLTLNLASNGLNEQSFGNLMDGCSPGEVGTTSCLLPRLHTLVISHNNFTMIPRLLYNLCPSLKHLAAVNNKIKSLTSLLQVLRTFRGKLETLHLMEDTTTISTTNLVCSKDFYREKIIFLLGTQFVQLDGGKISNNKRENARLKLEHELSIHPGYTADETKVKEHTLSTSREKQRMQNYTKVESINHGEFDGEETQEKIKTLEARIASLSAIIENYVSVAKSVDDTRCHNEDVPVVVIDVAKRSEIDKPESHHSDMHQRETAAAARFLLTIFSKRQHLSQLYIAFSLWRLSNRFDRHAKLSKVRQVESERTWAKRTKELVDQALSDETEKCKRTLDHSREAIQKSEERISQLTREVEDLEECLQNERRSQRTSEVIFNESSDAMKSEMHRLEVKLRKQISENKENVRKSENELNTLREKLHVQSELVAEERGSRTKVESLTMAYDEAKSHMAKDAALLNQLKLEVVSKDETIKSVKDAYEHAAIRSAADRSRCEQAVEAEQKAKDLLHRQTIILQNMEAETCRYVEDHQSRHSSKLYGLMREVEKKDERLKASVLRMKWILEERDDLRTQLLECKKVKSQAEEKNVYLEAQLNRAADAMLKAKVCSIDNERFDKEKSRVKDLKHSLDMLRRTSQEREHELMTKNNEDAEEYERMIKTLSRKLQLGKSEWTERVEQMESMHRVELQHVTNDKERDLSSAVNKLKAERKIRLELEEKVSKFQSEIAMQKVKMQSAIDSMVHKLSDT